MTETDFLFLKKLCSAFGPSGEENEVRDLIKNDIHPHVDSLRIDGMGNLIATVGNPEAVFLCAHMDEVGFMITEVMENGKLRFSQIGGVDPKHLPSKRVLIGKNRVLGVIGAKPIHLSSKSDSEISYNDLYIDIGCENRMETKGFICVGDSVVFQSDFSILGRKFEAVSGKALDNRLGCFLLCKLIKNKIVENGTFVFTVQEETGLRGALSFLKNNHFPLGIAIDTTTANDLPNITGPKMVCCTDSGPVISFADGATIYDRDLIRRVFSLLEKEHTKAQTKRKRTGGNEAAAIDRAGLGSCSISISVPCRYIHGPVGVVRVFDIEETEKALISILKNMKELCNAQ